MFSRLTGKKTLSQDDLKPVLAEMERHLMDKNVAKDIAEKMCDSVGAALVGKKLGGLTSKSISLLPIHWRRVRLRHSVFGISSLAVARTRPAR